MSGLLNDKLWAFVCATVIVIYAMWLKLPESISLANIVIGGLMGAAVGLAKNDKPQ
jgi:heme O synthase-like polyprenyltransferase